MRDEHVATVLNTIRATRKTLMQKYGMVEEVTRKDGNAHSVVTELDLHIEGFLRDRLRAVDPGIGFVGEEYGGDRSAERFWLCDPIDGTVHYVRGMPHCTVMLALIERHVVTFSVIYDFVNDVVYHAARGKGAYANTARIRVSERPDEDAYIFCEMRRETELNRKIFQALYENYAIMDTHSSGYEHMQVAAGKIEARVTCDPYGKDWDYAPGSLLVAEAGGIVANIGKRTYDYRDLNYLAASPNVFKVLTEGDDALFPIRE